MAKCYGVFRELRFVLDEELTEAFIAIKAVGDCPLGVQGWHHKTFGAQDSVLDILQGITDGDDPILWPQAAPR